jgi:hypothetical protein
LNSNAEISGDPTGASGGGQSQERTLAACYAFILNKQWIDKNTVQADSHAKNTRQQN